MVTKQCLWIILISAREGGRFFVYLFFAHFNAAVPILITYTMTVEDISGDWFLDI
jgi:hypothetical protein